MHSLSLHSEHRSIEVPAHLQTEFDSAIAFLQAQLAPATLRAYRSDFGIFRGWCEEHGLRPIPALPDSVVMFLAAQATAGLAVVTLERRLAAIRFAHLQQSHPSPTDQHSVQKVLAGIRRKIGSRAKNQKDPLLDHQVLKMLGACPLTSVGVRDRALMALAFAGAFRRSELVALCVEDLTFSRDGNLICLIRKSKTDQSGEGFEKPIFNGDRLMPVSHLKAWLDRSGIEEGLVFRKIDCGGAALESGISGQWVAKIIKRYASLIGVDPDKIGAHSMRSGFITSAGENDASFSKIMEVTGQKDPRTVQRYLRRPNLFKSHVGESFL